MSERTGEKWKCGVVVCETERFVFVLSHEKICLSRGLSSNTCTVIYMKKKNPSPVSVKNNLSNCPIKINTAMQQTVTQPGRLRPARTDFVNTKDSYSGF